MSNFAFLAAEWPELHETAKRAEALAHADPRAACFYARRALEQAVGWMYRNDRSLRLPYQDQLAALIHEPTFRHAVGDRILTKAKLIKDLGNAAVHSQRPVRDMDAVTAVRELFHVTFWLARTYARQGSPGDGTAFDASLLPAASAIPTQTLTQLQTLEADLAARDEKLSALLSAKATLDEELERLRDEVARAKAANAAVVDTHDYSEAATRDAFIDLLVKEAGWTLNETRDREYPVAGMPTAAGTNDGAGFVDYVLWGDDGKPLGLVEAKRTRRDARVGQQQAKLYADCLEQQFGQRPVIFYSNGYDHWLWDDASYPPRPVQGLLKKDELALLIQRRTTRLPLAPAEIDPAIVERYYQTRAIRRIAEAFEQDHDRKALVVMATGAGKTRTVIALCDLLMRCNWAKRILFLADRVALVNQAAGAFKRHLPAVAPVNLVTEKNTEGRFYVSTYPTMLRLIDETHDGARRFGVGHFDVVIIDEAHRSVYQKYRAIFDYFDSLLVGLTATPKDEVDHNTYSLFELETGVPTDAYGLDDAVNDGFLVPARSVSVPLKFEREGIRYDDLSDEDKEQWDALEWPDEGEVPDRVEAEAVNRWLFNKDTVDKVLEHLMTRGQTVAGGDRLGKTIVFAKNNAHAEFIADRFNANYPQYKGAFARVITFKTEYAQSLIDAFSIPERPPHIAISVDMLDTGIDVPEVVNLVFFKLVRSKTKFWQMLGRGTRLRPDLFGPGQPKEFFFIFDYCQNLEYFSQNPETTDGASGASLGKRLFTTRLEVLRALDRKLGPSTEARPQLVFERGIPYGDVATDIQVRHEIAGFLHAQVTAMDPNNFIVRPRRRVVEKFEKPDAWGALKDEDFEELARDLAGLPTKLPEEDEESKRFDLMMLRLQLALLRSDRTFPKLRDQVRDIAGILEDQSSIPMIRDQLELIQAIQEESWWEGVTIPMLETARKRLRPLMKLIEKARRQPVYTDFEDELGVESEVTLGGFGAGADFARFRAKTRQFLQAHENDLTIQMLRMNQPLTPKDLEALERMIVEAGAGTVQDLERARQENQGFGLFVRSLVGLDREAAKQAFGDFLSGKALSANQIEFVNLIVDHLVENGFMDPAALYASPYTDLSPRGPEGLFTEPQVDALVGVLQEVKQRALGQ